MKPLPEELVSVAERLGGEGAQTLAKLRDEEVLAAWETAVEAFLDPGSPQRRAVEEDLVRTTGLSPEGLQAGLEAVLGGVRGVPVRGLFAEAAERRGSSAPAEPRRGAESADGFALVVLASNLPALAVQPLVAALAVRRPVLLKSPSSEPVFAPVFAAALAEHLPALGSAVAAATWPGGDEAVEGPLLARAAVVVAYGDAPALEDLERRTLSAAGSGSARFVGYGPKTSLAVVGRHADLGSAAAGIARDVALFDQRGCLSVAAVYVEEGPEGGEERSRRLVVHLAGELEELARLWSPGPVAAADAAAVQQVRAEAELRGLIRAALPLAEGTLVVEPEPAMRPTPGLRTVRVHPLPDPGALTEILVPWRGRLQGAALAGASAEALVPALRGLGVSRIAPPGGLQTPDALWHNGGRHPLEAFLEATTCP